MKMSIAACVAPTTVTMTTGDPSYDLAVAVIGCGPSGISCATYLARYGYRNVTVYERSSNVSAGRAVRKTSWKSEVKYVEKCSKEVEKRLKMGEKLWKSGGKVVEMWW